MCGCRLLFQAAQHSMQPEAGLSSFVEVTPEVHTQAVCPLPPKDALKVAGAKGRCLTVGKPRYVMTPIHRGGRARVFCPRLEPLQLA